MHACRCASAYKCIISLMNDNYAFECVILLMKDYSAYAYEYLRIMIMLMNV